MHAAPLQRLQAEEGRNHALAWQQIRWLAAVAGHTKGQADAALQGLLAALSLLQQQPVWTVLL